jgi:hypothetical protein
VQRRAWTGERTVATTWYVTYRNLDETIRKQKYAITPTDSHCLPRSKHDKLQEAEHYNCANLSSECVRLSRYFMLRSSGEQYISLQRWHPPAILRGIGTQETTNPKLKSVHANVGHEVLTAVVVKSSIFWNITTCNPLKIYRCFGDSRNQCKARSKLLHAGFLLDLFFDLEYGGMFLRNVARFLTDFAALYPRRQNSFKSICYYIQIGNSGLISFLLNFATECLVHLLRN